MSDWWKDLVDLIMCILALIVIVAIFYFAIRKAEVCLEQTGVLDCNIVTVSK